MTSHFLFMNRDTSQFLITQNKQTYNSIAKDFSLTRKKIWPEFDFFIKNYIKDYYNILDVGCGNGRLFGALRENKNGNLSGSLTSMGGAKLPEFQFNYTGIDISEKIIDEANKQFINTKYNPKFLTEDILNPSSNFIKENKFDAVFAIAVLNHIPSRELRELAIQNIYKLLKPNGYLLMTNWNLWNITSRKSWWRLKILPFLSGNIIDNFSDCKLDLKDVITHWGQKKFPLYYYSFTKKEIKRLLQQNGFKIIDNFYSLKGKRTIFLKAENLATISQKI